jgi:hypothetical protein
MNNKQLTAILGYFFVTVLVSLSDRITPDFKWSDLFQPHVLIPALVSGVVTVTAYKSNGFQNNATKDTEDADTNQDNDPELS